MTPDEFVKSYFLSPGFNQRFKKAIPFFHNYYFISDNYDLDGIKNKIRLNRKNQLDSKIRIKKNINKLNNVIINKSNKNYYWFNNNTIESNRDKRALAHEMGHALTNAIEPFITFPSLQFEKSKGIAPVYPYIYPHFRKSTLYQKNLKKYKDNYEKDPYYYYNLGEDEHDGDPSELYADLIALREALFRLGIYDSRKANNPFNKKHLLKFKSLNKDKMYDRLLNQHTDLQIIQMMNEIAYNNSPLKLYENNLT